MMKTHLSAAKSMSNHIEEYFAETSQSKEVLTSKELFRANPEDVDIKTDLSYQEIILRFRKTLSFILTFQLYQILYSLS